MAGSPVWSRQTQGNGPLAGVVVGLAGAEAGRPRGGGGWWSADPSGGRPARGGGRLVDSPTA